MAHLGRPLCVLFLPINFVISLWLILASIRFGTLYDVGDTSIRDDIITFTAVKLLNASPLKVQEYTDEQKLACLSQRIPLEFNSTNYIAQADERKQVEGHMRVCLKIDAAFENMVTVSASEPLLSEAAYSIMALPSFNVPKAMKSVFDAFSIHQGVRGEFLIMLLFTIARDNAVGLPAKHNSLSGSRILSLAPFLSESLFRDSSDLHQLHTDFPNSKMHFNHYIKV